MHVGTHVGLGCPDHLVAAVVGVASLPAVMHRVDDVFDVPVVLQRERSGEIETAGGIAERPAVVGGAVQELVVVFDKLPGSFLGHTEMHPAFGAQGRTIDEGVIVVTGGEAGPLDRGDRGDLEVYLAGRASPRMSVVAGA